MGSLFSAPKVTTPSFKKALKANDNLSKSLSGSLKPVGIDAGGLHAAYNNGKISVNPTDGREGLVSDLASTFGTQADQIAALRAQIAPGVSALRTAQLGDIEDARRSAISTLSDNLARRRVLGSSFGNDALTRSNLDFEKQRNDVIAQTYLQEIDATNQLLNQEFQARTSAVSTKIGELNLQADLATKLTSQASDSLKASAQLQAELAKAKLSTTADLGVEQAKLDAGAQEGAGSLFGLIGQKVLGPTLGNVGTNVASSLFPVAAAA